MAAAKLLSMKSLLCFITPGHFLLLSSAPHISTETSGRCEHHLTSPVLPQSDSHCILQLALYEAGPVAGNLTVLIKPVPPGSAARSVALSHQRREDRRSANAIRKTSKLVHCCLCRIIIYSMLFLLYMQHNISIHN